jgi:hypothetical protein
MSPTFFESQSQGISLGSKVQFDSSDSNWKPDCHSWTEVLFAGEVSPEPGVSPFGLKVKRHLLQTSGPGTLAISAPKSDNCELEPILSLLDWCSFLLKPYVTVGLVCSLA